VLAAIFVGIGSAFLSMDPNYRRRAQNEDDFIFFIHPTLEEGTSSQSSQKKPIHTSIRNGATFIHETLTGHEALCKRRFHMEREIFQALVHRLRENDLLKDSRYVSVEEQLGIFLYAISKNASNTTLQDIFQHSGETISRHFRSVLDALTQLTCNYIRLPSLHRHRILRQPKFAPYFQVLYSLVYQSKINFICGFSINKHTNTCRTVLVPLMALTFL
jgi:hypothetical protein